MTIKELSLYLWAVLLVEVKKRGHPLSLMNLIYLGEKKANPDLAIEVILASGSLEKLEKYRRFEIPEVWLWENNQLQCMLSFLRNTILSPVANFYLISILLY
jgi:hypothetical protein